MFVTPETGKEEHMFLLTWYSRSSFPPCHFEGYVFIDIEKALKTHVTNNVIRRK